jgi:hypothetical protein
MANMDSNQHSSKVQDDATCATTLDQESQRGGRSVQQQGSSESENGVQVHWDQEVLCQVQSGDGDEDDGYDGCTSKATAVHTLNSKAQDEEVSRYSLECIHLRLCHSADPCFNFC